MEFGFSKQTEFAEIAIVGSSPWSHEITNASHSDDVIVGDLSKSARVAPTLVSHQFDDLFYQRKNREIGNSSWQSSRQSVAEHECHPHEIGYERLLNSHFRAAIVAVLTDQEAAASVYQSTVAHLDVDSNPLNPGIAATAADGNTVGGGSSDNVHFHISTRLVLQVTKELDIQYVVIHRQKIILRLFDLYLNETQICQAAKLNKFKRRKYTTKLKKRCITQKMKNFLWISFKHESVFRSDAQSEWSTK